MAPSAEMSDTWSTTAIPFRLMNTIPPLIMTTLVPLIICDENFPPNMHGEILHQYYRSIFYGYGFDGMTDIVQEPMNLMRWYPQTGLGSKFNTAIAELSIPDEYQQFLDKFEHVVLIAFGTTFMPKEKDILNIVEGAKLADP